jgi:hypothetical protein
MGMDFVAVVNQVIALLCQGGRATYRTLQRQFPDSTGLRGMCNI